jgi:flavorubredoxin
MSVVTEIGSDLYRISVYVPQFDLQFNHFLVKDEEPLLYHTGMKGMAGLVRDGVAKVMDPSRIRWISFSHFESDECGALNQWLELAPAATPVCSVLGAMINVNDKEQ